MIRKRQNGRGPSQGRRLQFTLSSACRAVVWRVWNLCASLGWDRLVLRCDEPWTLTAVTSDGDVLCNCNTGLKPFVLGNIREQTLGDIWEGPAYRRLRKRIVEGRLPSHRCVGCARMPKGRFLRFLEARRQEPVLGKVFLEPTATCNLRCVSCQNANVLQKRNPPTLPMDLCEKLLRDLEGTPVRTVYPFLEGEPFAHPRIGEILERIRSHLPRAFVLIHTNGILLDTEAKRRCVVDHVDQILFSIDGATQRSYQKYRVGGDFQKAFENMASLIRERDALGKPYPLVEWKYILFRWNSSARELARARRLAGACGVDRLIFSPTIRPFWGASVTHLLAPGRARHPAIGRLYTDRSPLNIPETRCPDVGPRSNVRSAGGENGH